MDVMMALFLLVLANFLIALSRLSQRRIWQGFWKIFAFLAFILAFLFGLRSFL
ncbi:hypothetical protein JIR001_15570 [Polycladomyces abyssicola]|uniref:Uncharacterized protein n=1 Tax=Polycladomyces abyssicola TaxID=1125966 RepID=A0A8D5UGD8_9BACL|nr:hypothetical protein [Polycladomyces abyssicola]BCU81774.1 hypothetical protein JIR001_15570 [Polycladomyces abyssicola]